MVNNWLAALHQLQQQGQAAVLVTVLGVTGSTPRETGTKMVVGQQVCFDTIGGGHLEYQAIQFAQQLITAQQAVNPPQKQQQLQHFQLASQLGQCCGGSVSVLFEYFPATAVNIMLFGAGHVAKALVPILAQLPCQVTWVDCRAHEFPAQYLAQSASNELSESNITAQLSDDEVGEVASMPANSYFLVMTHNHQLDFELCQAILRRDDFQYLGLIASQTKWRRFQQRLKHREFSAQSIARITSPIGLPSITGKKPMEVAISIAGQIINQYQTVQYGTVNNAATKQGIAWRDLQSLLTSLPQVPVSQQPLSKTKAGEHS